jgi:hypothetical protein
MFIRYGKMINGLCHFSGMADEISQDGVPGAPEQPESSEPPVPTDLPNSSDPFNPVDALNGAQSNPDGLPPDDPAWANAITIYISNLSYRVTEEDIRQIFEQHGRVLKVFPRRRRDQDFSGTAFVAMASREEGLVAISKLNGVIHNDTTLRVEEAHRKFDPNYRPQPRPEGARRRPSPRRDDYDDRHRPYREEPDRRRYREDDESRYHDRRYDDRARSPPRSEARRRSPPRVEDRRRSPPRYDDRRRSPPRYDSWRR